MEHSRLFEVQGAAHRAGAREDCEQRYPCGRLSLRRCSHVHARTMVHCKAYSIDHTEVGSGRGECCVDSWWRCPEREGVEKRKEGVDRVLGAKATGKRCCGGRVFVLDKRVRRCPSSVEYQS